jgi:hypothetical protein
MRLILTIVGVILLIGITIGFLLTANSDPANGNTNSIPSPTHITCPTYNPLNYPGYTNQGCN